MASTVEGYTVVKLGKKYESVYDFENNRALVQINGKWGAIDSDGNERFIFKKNQLT